MKWMYCLLLLLCPYVNMAQERTAALAVGDLFRYGTCRNVLNHPSDTIDLAAWTGKLLVLDFMHTGCVGCLQKLPAYDSLQQLFGNQLQFLVVTSQPMATVKKFLQQHRLGKLVRFPVITEDSCLRSLFPYEYISHLVVIGADARIKAITHGEYITATNIRRLLSGGAVDMPLKKDRPDFDYRQPLLLAAGQDGGKAGASINSSVFCSYINEVGSKQLLFETDTVLHTVRTALYNQPIVELYTGLYGRHWYPRSQVVLQVKDSSRYIPGANNLPWHSWMAANSYCYESILPAALPLAVQQQRIHEALDGYLGLHTRFVTREMPCLLLRQQDSVATPCAGSDTGFSLSTIVYELNQQWTGMPVLLAAGLSPGIQLPVPREWLPHRALLEPALQAAGYELLPVQRSMEVLLITDNYFSPNKLTDK